ncbi:MAG: OmpA family protein [Alistipes sp.]|nr:OmpA family protein [Alistipes sp.]
MKKILLVFCVALMACATATAQQNNDEKLHWKGFETNKFWDNWEVSAGVGISRLDIANKFNTDEPGKFFNRNSWNLNIGATKWIVPVVGLRLQLDGGHFQNYTFRGDRYGAGAFQTPYIFVHGDVMVNLSNWIGGYREDRLYYAIPYVGFGYTAMSWTKKTPGTYNGEYATTFGLLNKFRITKNLDVQLDLRTWIFAEEGLPAEVNGGGRFAFSWTGSVGVAYRFNKNEWTPAYSQTVVDGYVEAVEQLNREVSNAEANVSTLNNQVEELEAQNQELKRTLIPAGEEVISAHSVVFFEKNEYELSTFAMATIDKYVSTLKSGKLKITVVGYADRSTGTPEYNDALSQKRAEAVKEYMVAKGISEHRIEVKWVGATEPAFTEDDVEINRCVVIM